MQLQYQSNLDSLQENYQQTNMKLKISLKLAQSKMKPMQLQYQSNMETLKEFISRKI